MVSPGADASKSEGGYCNEWSYGGISEACESRHGSLSEGQAVVFSDTIQSIERMTVNVAIATTHRPRRLFGPILNGRNRLFSTIENCQRRVRTFPAFVGFEDRFLSVRESYCCTGN